MAEFITTKEISSKVEEIIKKSKKKLFLVSPYIQISKSLLERLKDASNREVFIKIIYGKDELKESEKNNLSVIKNLELYFHQDLHAKCYFNENMMVITSMNLYQYSEVNNREMGILIDRNIDKYIFEEALSETKSIIDSSNQIFLNSHDGVCIRCETNVEYNPHYPFCEDCYSEWKNWRNINYIENFCHRCGCDENTSKRIPQCFDCYNIWCYESEN